MIRYIKGIIYHQMDSSIIVENSSGIGFNIMIPSGSSFYKLNDGEEVKVHISMIVKEDDISLYGFSDREELELFELLITVSGIGAKGAMSIMSVLSPNALKLAIASGDSKSISKANGVGKKTAERIIIDLKDKLGSFDEAELDAHIDDKIFVNDDTRSEAKIALISLGYSQQEAENAISKIKGESLSIEDYIKLALKQM